MFVTIASFTIQPQLRASFEARPWGFLFPMMAVAGLVLIRVFGRQTAGELRAFLASCLFLVGMLTSAAFGVFPYVLPSTTDPAMGLTIYNTATRAYGLGVGLAWWIPGMLLAAAYVAYTHWQFGGKVNVEDNGHANL